MGLLFSVMWGSRLTLLGVSLLFIVVCDKAKCRLERKEETLSHWTAANGLNPVERYLAYSANYMRFTNNLFQLKNIMAAGVRTNRSVLVLGLADRPPDHLLDFKAMQSFMRPHTISYLPTLLTGQWNNTLATLGVTVQREGKKTRLITSRCYTFNGHTNTGGDTWHFRSPPQNLGTWSSLEKYLKSDQSEPITVLCDRASFYSISEIDGLAPIPFAPRLRDQAELIFHSLRAFTLNKSAEKSWLYLHMPLQDHGNPAFIVGEPSLGITGHSLGIHYRRTDYASMGVNVSTLTDIIQAFVLYRNVRRIFVATDAEEAERQELKRRLPEETVISCNARDNVMCRIPEEALLIEQGVCLLTDFFLGSPFSTVSLNIHQMRTFLYGKDMETSVLTNPEPFFGLWRPYLGFRRLTPAFIQKFVKAHPGHRY